MNLIALRNILLLLLFLCQSTILPPISPYTQLDISSLSGMHNLPLICIINDLNSSTPHRIKLISLHFFLFEAYALYQATASSMIEGGFPLFYEYSMHIGAYRDTSCTIITKNLLSGDFKAISVNTKVYLTIQNLVEKYYQNSNEQLRYLTSVHQNNRVYVTKVVSMNKRRDTVILYINDDDITVNISAVYNLS